MKKIKILVINNVSLKKNGITTMIYDYYSRFDKEHFDIHVIASGEYDEDVKNNFTEKNIKVVIMSSRTNSLVKYIFSLLKLCHNEKYDIIHVHGNSATMAIELCIAKLCHCKVRIAHSHNSTCSAKRIDKILRPIFYKVYTDAFACSEMAGKWLFDKNKFRIIKNGRDVKSYIYDEAMRIKVRSQMNIKDKTLAIGHVGSFNKQKNHKFLINVFAEILNKKQDCLLFLAGYGQYEDEIKKMVKDLGIEKKVIFLGVIHNVNEFLQAMDVMVLPSLHEGLPLVVIEWQMAALPSVLSDTITNECAFTELVKFKSLNDSFESWADLILDFSKIHRNENSLNISELAIDNGYDIEQNVRELMNLFYLKLGIVNKE